MCNIKNWIFYTGNAENNKKEVGLGAVWWEYGSLVEHDVEHHRWSVRVEYWTPPLFNSFSTKVDFSLCLRKVPKSTIVTIWIKKLAIMLKYAIFGRLVLKEIRLLVEVLCMCYDLRALYDICE